MTRPSNLGIEEAGKDRKKLAHVRALEGLTNRRRRNNDLQANNIQG